MKFHTNNSIYRYAFIVCLSITLLFSQTFKVHMHIQHDESVSETSQKHIVDVHVDVGSSLHNSSHNTHHQDDFLDHQYHAEVDVSTDSFVKKVGLSNLSVLLFFIIGFILLTPRLQSISRRYILKIKPISFYYLLLPPLRAPPIK